MWPSWNKKTDSLGEGCTAQPSLQCWGCGKPCWCRTFWKCGAQASLCRCPGNTPSSWRGMTSWIFVRQGVFSKSSGIASVKSPAGYQWFLINLKMSSPPPRLYPWLCSGQCSWDPPRWEAVCRWCIPWEDHRTPGNSSATYSMCCVTSLIPRSWFPFWFLFKIPSLVCDQVQHWFNLHCHFDDFPGFIKTVLCPPAV